METIDYRPSVSGYYFIDAQSYRNSFYNNGFYLINLTSNVIDDFEANLNTTSNLQIEQTKNATIENAGDADWHKVGLTAGYIYSIKLTGLLSNGYIKIFDTNGLETNTANSGQVIFSPSKTDSYYLEVSGSNLTDSGGYGITVVTLPTITLSNGYQNEGLVGTTMMEFTLSLSTASPYVASVKLDTVNDTAIDGVDYLGIHKIISIPAGSTSVKVSVPIIGNSYFQPNRAFEINLSAAENAVIGNTGYGYIYDDDKPTNLTLPTDPLIGFQWYLYTVRAIYAWEKATGAGVKVGVFDQGIDATNPDLQANTNTLAGRNALNLTLGGAPVAASDNHGTWVAGVIGAASDGIGIVGIAYNSQLVPIYTSSSFSSQYINEITNAFKYAKTLDVLNNSWGFGNLLFSGTNWAFLDNANSAIFSPAFVALKDLVSTGRDNLGTVVVQSSGNSYSVGDDANLHNFQNSKYIITVGATDYFGKISSFSTTGASILVSAPGGGGGTNANSILTTDRTGILGTDPGNYKYVDGTSFSSPVVSGVIALMLEVNPNLGYRDVQQILAYTAQQIETGVGTWRINGANDWNGGGLHYNALEHASGFGQVDALAAVRLAAAWDFPAKTVSNTKEIILNKTVNQLIPDNNPSGVYSDIFVSESMRVERVDVTVRITHPYIGDLSILLSSPSGVTSFLLYRPAAGALSAYGSSQANINFTFDTVLNWGEDSAGSWLLGVYDNAGYSVGTLDSWSLNLIGAPSTNNKTIYFTNEFAKMVTLDPSRSVFSDPTGGPNTLNAAALGSDSRIDLSGASASVLIGANLTIAKGTTVIQAVGGDGNDVLIANDLGNTLRGMAGSDRITGGAGNDNLDGGVDIDTVVYATNRVNSTLTKTASGWSVSSGVDGSDTLSNVERLQFGDKKLVLDLSPTEHGGQALEFIGLVAPALVNTPSVVGLILGLFDQGKSLHDVCQMAIDVGLVNSIAGSGTNAALAAMAFRNLIGSEADASTVDMLVGFMDGRSASYSQTDFMTVIAGLDLNQTHIGLVGLQQSGIEYV
jgi:subtilisin-like proprotein convertase family protein